MAEEELQSSSPTPSNLRSQHVMPSGCLVFKEHLLHPPASIDPHLSQTTATPYCLSLSHFPGPGS